MSEDAISEDGGEADVATEVSEAEDEGTEEEPDE